MAKAKPRPQPPSADSYESHFEHAALLEFSSVINSSTDPKFIFNHILLTIMGKILATKGMVLVAEARGKGKYVMETVKGFPAEIAGSTITIPRVPKTLFYLDRVNVSRHPWARFFRQHGVKILLPMFIADHLIGVLGFGERFAARRLESREESYLRSLANISATAVEKSRTIEATQAVNRELDRDKLVRLLVFSLMGQVGVTRYLICLREGPDMKVVASRLDGPPPQSELLAALARTKTAARVPDLIVRDAFDPRPVLAALGLCVVVPIQLQGENKGLILLGEKLSREAFTPADLEFLASLGNLAIISLENARLFKETIEKQKLEDELLIAREIQKGLLPSVLPDIPGIGIAATNISSKQVGGDYYDVIPAAAGSYIIAIGDVSGKGTPAALLMANLQATIRALVPLNLPLSELTQRVNDLMCLNTGGNKFVTFFWGVIDPLAMTLQYVNAGHNYPYLMHSDGGVDRLDRGGMILGVMKTAIPYEQATVPLRERDLLVLFTDGVSEAMSKEAEEYGEQRLEEVLRARAERPPGEIVEAVHEDILRHTAGAPQSDDITMMVLNVRPRLASHPGIP